MCGIVSIGLRPESSYWRKMCEYITGSNKNSFQENGCSASSNCDFYVKDVADKKCFVAFDGEINNYDRLRKNLQMRGAVFATESCAELILHSYFAFGKTAFKNLHGSFAIAIWDGYKQELILVRDKIGFKPLFYYFDGTRLVFSSRICGVLKFPFVKKDFCDDIYCKLFTLAGSKLAFDTLFDKIYEVPPSAIVTYRSGRIKTENYFMFDMESTTDSFSQTLKGLDFLLADRHFDLVMTEKPMLQNELENKIKEYVLISHLPSPYIDLNDLSNLGSTQRYVSSINLFTIPKRFKLPIKNCEGADREFVNDFLSTLPPFSYTDEKDITIKEEMYIKMSVVLPQVITAKTSACENIVFPYLQEQIFEYCLKSMKYKERLLRTYFVSKKPKPLKENIKVLKKLFSKMISDKNAMLGLVQREELLRFTRLFPRPETMLYLLQADMWLNMFL